VTLVAERIPPHICANNEADGYLIVCICEVLKSNILSLTGSQLIFKSVLIKMLLELLIRVVDAKLQ
jgi:hypothetical protein